MTEQFSWRVIILPRAERDMKRLPVSEQRRIRAGVDLLAADPARADILKLHGVDDEWRLRVGDWRVRFSFDPAERAIIILRVLLRKDVYRER